MRFAAVVILGVFTGLLAGAASAQEWRIHDTGPLLLAVVEEPAGGGSFGISCLNGSNLSISYQVGKTSLDHELHAERSHLVLTANPDGLSTAVTALDNGTDNDETWSFRLSDQQELRVLRDLAKSTEASVGLVEHDGDPLKQVLSFAVNTTAVNKILDNCKDAATAEVTEPARPNAPADPGIDVPYTAGDWVFDGDPRVAWTATVNTAGVELQFMCLADSDTSPIVALTIPSNDLPASLGSATIVMAPDKADGNTGSFVEGLPREEGRNGEAVFSTNAGVDKWLKFASGARKVLLVSINSDNNAQSYQRWLRFPVSGSSKVIAKFHEACKR